MTIQRFHTNKRMSQIVVHNDLIYLAGQVGNPGDSVAEQTQTILSSIDELLAEVGSSREHILQAIVWMADMNDFAEMNEVWDQWIPEGHAPARATGEAKLATPDYKVEVIVTAVKVK